MNTKEIAINYFKRFFISAFPIPFLVFGFSWMGLSPDHIILASFIISAILLEVQLYHERKSYAR